MVILVPVPVVVINPGERVNVQVPEAGKPLNNTLPVATVQVGCVIVPTIGADGAKGCALITTFEDVADVHPAALVTVKEKIPGSRPGMVVVDPLPVVVTSPGLRVIVQVPGDGREYKNTLPVANIHVG